MDAFVQLALIEKAKRVFAADPSVMLSFPLLAPIGFTAAELAALIAPATTADYAAAGDFARTVNFLPTDVVATATERTLWDVYRDVLDRAEVGDLAPGGGVGPSVADVLYEPGPDGIRVESEALKRYRQYRDAWIVTREDYAAHKLTGELSEDPAERQHWTESDEPALRTALDAAAIAWETLGGRAVIEGALQAERDAAFRDPRRRWAEWNKAFDPEIDMVTDVGGQYAPTGFSPRNFADQDGWLTFDLSAAEMRTLVDEAPETLKRVLDDDSGTSVERVSFEYRSVSLVRPWFRPEVLTSGIWRSSDPALLLSDGADPPSGVCPAYASACVFVRNVKVTEQGTSTGKAFPLLRFTLDPASLMLQRNLRVDPGIAAQVERRRAVQLESPDPMPRIAPRAFQTLENNSFVKVVVSQRTAPNAAPINLRRLDLRRDATIRDHKNVTVRDHRNVTVRDHRNVSIRTNTNVPIRPKIPGTPTPSPAPPPQPPPRDEISILAFICKRLPKTPDPAPELDWS